jgi:signal transduction histidine kinase
VPIAMFVLLYSLVFTMIFLEIRTKIRELWIPSLVLVAATIGAAVLWWCGLREIVYYSINYITIPLVTVCVVAALLSGIRGNLAAWIYLVAWSILLAVVVIEGLFFIGLVPMTQTTFILPQFGFSSELLLMSVALAYRIRLLQRDRQSALLENERIVRDQNAILERTVHERTLALEDTNHQLAAANEEVQRQLEVQTEQAQHIELSNVELQTVTDNLAIMNNEIAGNNKALESANAQLAHRNQELADAEQFRLTMLSVVSHDLKSPISGILGLSSVLLDNKELPEQSRLMLTHILDAGERMHNLVLDLLDTAALQMGTMQLFVQPTELRTLVLSIVSHYANAAAQKEQAFIVPQSGEYRILGDEQRLRQVFDNIISNAIKYSPRGGTITITFSTVHEAQHEAQHGFTRVAVRDEGVGFTQEDKAKIFRLFQRLSALPTGEESSSGVGLAVVKQIVELHNGRVWVESEHNRGATFTVELPNALHERQ